VSGVDEKCIVSGVDEKCIVRGVDDRCRVGLLGSYSAWGC
jgi:hypothetical protein